MSSNPCDASIFSQILSGNAIVCSDTLKSYEASSAKSQIQTVADNAAKNYGAESISAQVAAQAAKAEQTQVESDVSNVTDSVGNSTAGKVFGATCNGEPGVDLSFIGGPCLTNTLLKEIGLGLLLAVLAGVALYGMAVFGPLIPKGRS